MAAVFNRRRHLFLQPPVYNRGLFRYLRQKIYPPFVN